MKTTTIKTTAPAHQTQIDMAQFERKMLAAEASGQVDLIEVPAQKPANKIFVVKKESRDYSRSRWEFISRENQSATMNRKGLQMMYLPYKKMLELEDENFFDYNINLGISWAYGCPDFEDVPYNPEVVGKYAKLAKFLQDVATDDLGYVKAWIKSCNGGGVGTENVGWHYPWYSDVAQMQMSAHRLNGKAHALKLKTREKHGRWISREAAVKLVLECPTMPMSKLATVAAAQTFKLSIRKRLEKRVLKTGEKWGQTGYDSAEGQMFKDGWKVDYAKDRDDDKYSYMYKNQISFQIARDSLVLREIAKRKSVKGEALILEDFSPVGGRAQSITLMKRKSNHIWLPTTLHKFHGEKGWFLINTQEKEYWDGEWEIPFIQKIPLGISSGDEKLILENKALVIYQLEKVGGQKVVDVKKTLANIGKFNKAKEVELEGVNLKVLREFSRAGYKFQFGWTQKIDRAKPRVLSVEEPATGEIYQVSSYQGETVERVIENAVRAFQKRAAAKVMQQEVEKVVSPDEGVLVYLQDSYAVGNCQSGTAAWVERMGFAGLSVVPLWKVHEAAEKSNNDLARNVVKHVVAEYLEQKKVA